MDVVLAGLQDAFAIQTIIYVALGVFIGLAVGAIPGLSGGMAIALCVPLTYYMPAVAAIGFLIGINKGGYYGGSISAVLLNTPGAAEAAATSMDGYPLAKQGKGIKAIKMALYASTFGDLFATCLLLMVAGPIAGVAMRMGPPEVCSLIILSLTLISVLEAGDLWKGLAAAALGMLISTIGVEPVAAEPRFTFDIYQLEKGVTLIPMTIGLLALSELLVQAEGMYKEKFVKGAKATLVVSSNPADSRVTLKEYVKCGRTLLRSSVAGSIVGALPGLGAAVAAFLAYGLARNASKHPEEFGNGSLEGIAAAESANNAVVGSSMIPLFTLGIPGNISSAILIGAFILHGVNPGPLMFEQNAQLVYGVYGAMILSCLGLLVIGYFGIKFFARLLSAPKVILMPIIMFICMLGAYLSENSTFSVGVMVVFGVIGYVIKKTKVSFICLIIGFILGPMFEMSLQQTIISYYHKPFALFYRPITVAILALTLIMCLYNGYRAMRQNRREKALANG